MKILIVDDEAGNRKLLEMLLSPYGNCDFAINGLQAVELFEEALKSDEPYGLVCLDIIMPEMNGQDTLKKMRDLEVELAVPNTIIWMTTSEDSRYHKIEAIFKRGCNAYILKPYTKVQIQEHLRNHGITEKDS